MNHQLNADVHIHPGREDKARKTRRGSWSKLWQKHTCTMHGKHIVKYHECVDMRSTGLRIQDDSIMSTLETVEVVKEAQCYGETILFTRARELLVVILHQCWKGKKNCLKGFESSNENCKQCSASVPKPGKWQISPAICSCLRSQHLHPLQFFLVALEPSWKMRGWTSENRIGARKCSWKGWPVQDYAFDWVIVSLDKSEQSCNKPR